MKIYTKIVLDTDNNLIEEEYYYYTGPMAFAGIHYDFKSTKGNKLMEKQAKLRKNLSEKLKKVLKKIFQKKNL